MPAQCFLVFSTPHGVEYTHRRFTMKTCAFTGHRPKGLGYPESDGRCDALKRLLRLLVRRLIQEQSVTHFISGMAQGVDQYAAEIVLELKEAEQYMVDCADVVLAVCMRRRRGGGLTLRPW